MYKYRYINIVYNEKIYWFIIYFMYTRIRTVDVLYIGPNRHLPKA